MKFRFALLSLLLAVPLLLVAADPPLTNTLYFPQVVYGGGYSTTFVITNTGTVPVASSLNFYDQAGLRRLDLTRAVTLPAGNSTRITIPNSGGAVTVVWGELIPGAGTVQGVATFDYRAPGGTLITTAGVLGLQAGNGFLLPVDVTSTADTGVAIGNSYGILPVAVQLRLLGENGVQAGITTLPLIASGIIFPKLALGMSGFETGVSVMPHVSGATTAQRVRATRLLLASAALIMSVYLLLSSVVTTVLIPADAFASGGPASGRAIAYLAHLYLGSVFGTVYDISTILILWFAGASAMAGLINLVPRYMPRFGMAPRWVSYRRALVIVLFVISVIVTVVFNADVEAQAGAYATGVLVLMLSAAIAVALALWRELHPVSSIYFWVVSGVFAFALVDNIIERPDGVIIATVFIVVIIVVSAVSRYMRSTELRVAEVTFGDESTAAIWADLTGKKVNLVPLRSNTRAARRRKADELHRYYEPSGPLAFIHVNLLDNRSEFLAPIQVRVTQEEENFVIEVNGAIAIANTIAYISELIDPISIFLGLTRQDLMTQSLRFLIFGEGETGLLVYTILLKYWESTPEDDVRPLIFLMSE